MKLEDQIAIARDQWLISASAVSTLEPSGGQPRLVKLPCSLTYVNIDTDYDAYKPTARSRCDPNVCLELREPHNPKMSTRVLLREYPHRSIALVTPTHALIFHHSPSNGDALSNGSLTSLHTVPSRTSVDGASAPKCMVEFADVGEVDLSDYRTLSPLPVHGTLGLITISNDVFLCVVTGATKVASVRPGETVEKIFGVDFHCLNSADYDNNFSDNLDPYSMEGQEHSMNRREPLFEHPCVDLKKLLSNGSFYYSTDFDVTQRVQDRSIESATFDIDNLDESFLWNSYMIKPLVKFRSRLVEHERQALDHSRILTSAIRGFVLTITIPTASAPLSTQKTGLPSTLTLISRLSCRRAGTRFNSRGIDDDGNVANFVESETVYWSPTVLGQSDPAAGERPTGICFSYAQIRGSVPVFWEQAPGLLPGQQKITITRSAEGSQPAFDKHFGELEQNYGAVHVVNLLSETKPGEAELTAMYRHGIKHSALNRTGDKNAHDHQLLRDTEFDFHAETKGPNGYEAASLIRRLIEGSAEGFAYYLSEDIEDPVEESIQKFHRRTVVTLQQEGVFRTNCLDCLDRTNLIQTIISQMAIEKPAYQGAIGSKAISAEAAILLRDLSFLEHRSKHAASDFWMRHSSLWADNGDALSRIYAGTGALKSSFTRHGKMSLAGAIADARKSATRLYINNFADKGRQNTIDVLLGRLVGQTPVHLFDPINDYVTTELSKRNHEYQTSETINIFAGTFNLNGRTSGIEEDLSAWLCPAVDPSQQQPEIVAVGFQEIVELSPQQIMNSDPMRKQQWERAVRKTLNRHARAAGSDHYLLLRSGQLVGAALCIFVKASALKHIKNVEGAVKKTGMSGMAGNKGAVAIRMDFANTHLCFVTAHLAAGFANYEERNRDFNTINHGLRFQRNRGIDNHDSVIWMGDFNYRIGLGSEKVKQLIKMGDLETLYENDQLNLQMVAGLTFPYYSESRITFMPTYKFDLGNDTYDSSEKARIPAWTDRILRKGSNIRQVHYNTAPLRFSDHRPVYATFQCSVSIVDEVIRESLSREIYERRRLEMSNATPKIAGDDTDDDDDLLEYDAIEPNLPPASSDRRKWWLDNSQPARSTVNPPQHGMIPNANRPSNPYTPTNEPDWVKVPRVTPRTNTSTPPPRPNANGARRLPPPFKAPDTSAAVFAKNIPQSSLQDSTSAKVSHVQPSSPSDRRLSTSTNSSSSRKAPPPVARKPPHLASSTSSNSIPTLSTLPSRPAVNQKQNLQPSSVDKTGFIPLPRKTVGTAVGSKNGTSDNEDRRNVATPPPAPQPRRTGGKKPLNGTASNDYEEPKPNLPPRRMNTDLLGDNGDMKLSGWETLKPS